MVSGYRQSKDWDRGVSRWLNATVVFGYGQITGQTTGLEAKKSQLRIHETQLVLERTPLTSMSQYDVYVGCGPLVDAPQLRHRGDSYWTGMASRDV